MVYDPKSVTDHTTNKIVSLYLQFCRYFRFYTSHGRYSHVDTVVDINKWIRFTMVYDPESATDIKVNKLFLDSQMYSMYRDITSDKITSQGTGQTVLGRRYNNKNYDYTDELIDDLKMWNQKLSDEEIVALTN